MAVVEQRGLDRSGRAVLVPALRFLAIDQFVVLIDCQDAMRREAFDGEWLGDADFALVFVGFVVEVFGIGLRGNGGVDFLLSCDALLPPVRVQFSGLASEIPNRPLEPGCGSGQLERGKGPSGS